MLKLQKCQDNDYQCPPKYEFLRQIKAMHDVDVYKCDFCSDEFMWEYSLKYYVKKIMKCLFQNSRCGKTVYRVWQPKYDEIE